MTNNIDEILKLNKEDLYALLEANNDIDVDVSLEELSNIDVEENFDVKIGIDLLYNATFSLRTLSGKKSLRNIWRKVRFVICTIYKANPKIGEKDLISAVIATLGIAGNWATALVALALKLGLDKVCSVYK